MDGRNLSLSRSGMGLTLDGIAKGYIVDAMADALRAHGATRFLINAGGDIRAAGDRGDELPWTIAIRDPEDSAPSWDSESWRRSVVPDLIRITSGAVATSGSYEVYFDREQLAHHIVQGRTGRSPDHAMSVTVTAATTMEADALATAVFVLGPVEGAGLINGLAGCECLIIDRQGKQVRSDGWSGMAASGGEPGKRVGGAGTGANGQRDV
jgi:thiamine biosynthesis lipoprotein